MPSPKVSFVLDVYDEAVFVVVVSVTHCTSEKSLRRMEGAGDPAV